MTKLNLNIIHLSWQPWIKLALEAMEPVYLKHLEENEPWLPGHENIFNAFSLPLNKVRYILFGESPYPRSISANGYAFWDAAVETIWSEKGLSKPVNRATSLRNFIKMLLVAEGYLHADDTSQQAIANLDKTHAVKKLNELFENMHTNGIMLLNASLVLSDQAVSKDAKAWRPFIETLLNLLSKHHTHIQLVLLGNIAKEINKIPAAKLFKQFCAEHPYNVSFISNTKVLDFFRPLHLLDAPKVP